jgi:hypothetical protein
VGTFRVEQDGIDRDAPAPEERTRPQRVAPVVTRADKEQDTAWPELRRTHRHTERGPAHQGRFRDGLEEVLFS